MNQKSIIVTLVAALAIGGGVFFVSNKDKDDTNKSSSSSNNSSQETKSEEKSTAKTAGTFDELIGGSKNQECTISFADDGETVTGTAYFSKDKRMRMDFSTDTEGAQSQGSMIITESEQTIWDAASNEGFKFSFDAADANTETEVNNQGLNTDQEVDFTCKDWKLDESKFTVPSDVTVTDFSDFQLPSLPVQE